MSPGLLVLSLKSLLLLLLFLRANPDMAEIKFGGDVAIYAHAHMLSRPHVPAPCGARPATLITGV